jgi:hypothetical protein
VKKTSVRGVPKDEVFLAKIIQNAKARGLKFTRGTFYRDAKGRDLASNYSEDVTHCCAAGAALLTDKETPWMVWDGLPQGNDNSVVKGSWSDQAAACAGVTIGLCYRDVMLASE